MWSVTITNWAEATRTRLQFGCQAAADKVKDKLTDMNLADKNVAISEVEEIGTAGLQRGPGEMERVERIMSILFA